MVVDTAFALAIGAWPGRAERCVGASRVWFMLALGWYGQAVKDDKLGGSRGGPQDLRPCPVGRIFCSHSGRSVFEKCLELEYFRPLSPDT